MRHGSMFVRKEHRAGDDPLISLSPTLSPKGTQGSQVTAAPSPSLHPRPPPMSHIGDTPRTDPAV